MKGTGVGRHHTTQLWDVSLPTVDWLIYKVLKQITPQLIVEVEINMKA